MSSPTGQKRPADDKDRSVSPPPLKRKARSTISKSAVAHFFTPTSKKPKDRTTWSERSAGDGIPATLLVAKYVPEKGDDEALPKRRKIAAFDLDSTLITSASGKRHSDSATDWKWWDRSVPTKMKQLYHEEGYRVIILTNQGGLTLHPDPNSKAPKRNSTERVSNFKQKVNAVLTQLDIPLTLYGATGKDIFRKPRTGMWKEMCKDYGLDESDIDLQNSIFVGDAGGRKAYLKGGKAIPKDFSCSDRNLAENIGIPFKAPEEFFLGENPRDFARDFDLVNFPFAGDHEEIKFEKKNDQELVLFCGPPGAGKSTFFWKHLKPLGFERVNQDLLKSKDKCFKAATELLRDGESVAVDATNPDPDTRAQWVALGNKHKVPTRCVWFRTPIQLCEHNDAVRSLNKELNPEERQPLPKLAFTGFTSRFKEPKLKEGFQDIVEVDFRFRGTRAEYDIWAKYWL
ncbi:Polynucleotide kinase 3 phosphatase [Coniochaeta hoffmannii]|uniref:Polynucleotide kinase 3 phosphatase n=1 Tax=Coniochaeta hoffmannii TaxID=91930 RepID=A0AA38RA22_9PEZI|nr:Polynucleotide kinase 3 phosphatase [Coniochaeta hoffmannii]